MGVLTHPVKCLRDGIGASRLQCPPRPSKSKGKWNVRINYRGQILPEPQEASDIPRLFPELAAEIRRSVEYKSGPACSVNATPRISVSMTGFATSGGRNGKG